MLLTNRRHRLMYGALAGMALAWILPYVLLFINYWITRGDPATVEALGITGANARLAALLTMPALALFAFFWLIMLCYMIASDTLNRSLIGSPGRELILITLILGTSVLSARLLLYPGLSAFDFGWLGDFFNAIFNFHRGRRPELVLLLLNLLLWFRVSALTSRELSFFSVGLSFRLGLLLAITGGALLNRYASLSTQNGMVYLALFFAFGLTAVALARMNEKAYQTTHSAGRALPWPRFAQILAMVGAVLASAWALGQLYTPESWRSVIDWFSPLWTLIGVAASQLLLGLAWLLAPLLNAMIALFSMLLAQVAELLVYSPQAEPFVPPEAVELTQLDLDQLIQNWTPIRYGLVAVALALALGLIWIFFARTRGRSMGDEAEEVMAEPLELDGNLLQKGLQRLRNWADLMRRYGVGTQLLAAVSVENIYANVSRMARQRGYPRRQSQPPDEYIAQLVEAFPGCGAELQRITNAYMKVEYGDVPAMEDELTQLREDFNRVKRAPKPVSIGAALSPLNGPQLDADPAD